MSEMDYFPLSSINITSDVVAVASADFSSSAPGSFSSSWADSKEKSPEALHQKTKSPTFISRTKLVNSQLDLDFLGLAIRSGRNAVDLFAKRKNNEQRQS